MMPRIDEAILSLQMLDPISVRGFDAETFAAAVGADVTLLVFLRHFG